MYGHIPARSSCDVWYFSALSKSKNSILGLSKLSAGQACSGYGVSTWPYMYGCTSSDQCTCRTAVHHHDISVRAEQLATSHHVPGSDHVDYHDHFLHKLPCPSSCLQVQCSPYVENLYSSSALIWEIRTSPDQQTTRVLLTAPAVLVIGPIMAIDCDTDRLALVAPSAIK